MRITLDINPFNPYTERQKQTSSAFHFSCDCARCKRSSDSDLAINKIKGLEKLLAEWYVSLSVYTKYLLDHFYHPFNLYFQY